MSPKLPDVNIDAISSLDEAKQILKQVLNSFEQFLQMYEQQQKEVIELRQEIARLKQQPRKPQFPQKKQSFSATKLVKDTDKHWQKKARKPIEIDHHETLPEVDTCICGSTDFKTVNT